MRTQVFLKTQTELRDDIEGTLADSDNVLATAEQYYRALNQAIQLWGGRVVAPHLYEFDFRSGIFEYALPDYIRRPFYVSVRTTIMGLHGLQLDQDDSSTFQDFIPYDVEPDGLGGARLRVHSYPYAETGRIIWFQENGPVPLTLPTLSAGIAADDSTLTLTVSGNPHVNNCGYLYIDGEWLAYSGLTRTSPTSYSASNLVRGLYGTPAAAHTLGDTVECGVGVDDMRLWQQLYDRAGSYIHFYNLHKSTSEDMARHERLYIALKTAADSFWKQEGYVTQRAPRLIPKRGSMGPMPW